MTSRRPRHHLHPPARRPPHHRHLPHHRRRHHLMNPAGAGAATPMYPGSGAPDIGAAFSWAFAKFGQNWAVLVSMAAILVVIRILDGLLSSILDGGVDDCSGNLTQQQAAECVARVGGFALGTLLVTLVMALVSAVVIVGIIQASLRLTRGETPEFSDLWTPTNFWQYILVTIVFWICMFFGLIGVPPAGPVRRLDLAVLPVRGPGHRPRRRGFAGPELPDGDGQQGRGRVDLAGLRHRLVGLLLELRARRVVHDSLHGSLHVAHVPAVQPPASRALTEE
ncbi:MAG: hypothetical protein V9G23_13955 [Giesbergeria sp.]